jgi:excinuclease ABC subunit A
VSKAADWIIDLGPEGGTQASLRRLCTKLSGGEIVAAGTPEDIVREKRSYTGQFLKPVLARGADSAGGRRRKRIEAAE